MFADVYLLGTVMLVFGMGLYELFVSNLDIAKSLSDEKVPYRSNFFGLFTLKVSKLKPKTQATCHTGNKILVLSMC